MYQILFEIPTPWSFKIPIYGFGTMLVIALFLCTWLATRRAKKEGIAPERIQDLALWVVIFGIIGARVVYMIQYDQPFSQFLQLWQGGLVFYGSVIGGTIGLLLAHVFVFRKHNVSWLKMADVIAPSAAIGLSIGRIGCLLNGCCYGEVACPQCLALGFPLSAPARIQLVDRGLQTAAGFTVDWEDVNGKKDCRSTVGWVEPGSPAEKAGLQKGDYIVAVNGEPNRVVLDVRGDESRLAALADSLAKNGSGKVTTAEEDNRLVGVKMYYPRNDNDDIARTDSAFLRDDEKEVKAMEAGSSRFEIRRYDVLWERLAMDWPRGRQNLELTVRRPGEDEDIKLPPFRPKTLGLHPTQLYETISMAILFLLLTAYYPFRRLDGQVMGLFLTLYAVHRFLNELLRNDTDPVAFGMTLSQNGSVLVLLLGLVLLNRDRLARALQPVRRALVGG